MAAGPEAAAEAAAEAAEEGRAQEDLDHEDVARAEERSAPPAAIVYEAVRREGQAELRRPTSALAWSGLAAGMSMGFSALAQAMIAARLPDADWEPLMASFGYSVGFLIVIPGRQQLCGPFLDTLIGADFAGWLIALIVWVLPFAESARIFVIIITYVIGLGEFPHIIAGSVEVLYVAASGAAPARDYVSHYFVPTLIGNIAGGVALVAALNHAQVVAGRAAGARDRRR